jgi:hypothetical protein
MEPHRTLELGPDVEAPSASDAPAEYFRKALAFATRFYGDEIRAIASVSLEDVTPEFFFREYAWVVHATGFSAKAVGKFMPRLLEAYGPWDKLAKESAEDMFGRVKLVCNNLQKAKAVQATAKLMADRVLRGRWETADDNWREFRGSTLADVDLLSGLPYVGNVTKYHLGRNIGLLDCVKPDLHLVRMAEHWGYPDCARMCEDMGAGSGLRLGIVDLVLWYAASTFGTGGMKKDGKR